MLIILVCGITMGASLRNELLSYTPLHIWVNLTFDPLFLELYFNPSHLKNCYHMTSFFNEKFVCEGFNNNIFPVYDNNFKVRRFK